MRPERYLQQVWPSRARVAYFHDSALFSCTPRLRDLGPHRKGIETCRMGRSPAHAVQSCHGRMSPRRYVSQELEGREPRVGDLSDVTTGYGDGPYHYGSVFASFVHRFRRKNTCPSTFCYFCTCKDLDASGGRSPWIFSTNPRTSVPWWRQT